MLEIRLLVTHFVSPLQAMEKIVPQPKYDNEQGLHLLCVIINVAKQYCFDKFAIVISTEIQTVKSEVERAFRDIPVSEVI